MASRKTPPGESCIFSWQIPPLFDERVARYFRDFSVFMPPAYNCSGSDPFGTSARFFARVVKRREILHDLKGLGKVRQAFISWDNRWTQIFYRFRSMGSNSFTDRKSKFFRLFVWHSCWFLSSTCPAIFFSLNLTTMNITKSDF